MDKIDLKDRSRYVKRLHSRVMRKRRIQLVLLSVVIAAVLVWVSVALFNTLKNFHFPSIKFGGAPSTSPKRPTKFTFAIIGIDQQDYEQYVSGISLIVYDPNEKTVNGLAFKKQTRLQLPGYGLDILEKALFAGLDSTLASVHNVTGIKFDRYIMVDSSDYGNPKTRVKKGFGAILQTNFTQKQQLQMSSNLKAIEEDDINILEAPTRLVAVGKEPYEQLKKKELNRLVQILWGLPKPIKRYKVIVLNGVGTSGLAGKVGMKVIKAGYEVLDIKNANSFNYKNTLIIVYSQKMQKEAFKVQKLLGYGNIMLELDKQGLTDMTIIIGKDYKKK